MNTPYLVRCVAPTRRNQAFVYCKDKQAAQRALDGYVQSRNISPLRVETWVMGGLKATLIGTRQLRAN